MKTLKKVLSLVLVVAMIASMCIVGAAATTEETTNYPVAADVISGIKVMEGDERGMRYGDTVTREEAAAIVCRVLLGDTAETLTTAAAPFADVAASRWSAGYIAYLKQLGIVSGVSDTEFDPTGKVTGIAFAKMLLVAAGYGANDEFEGASWDINVITTANENGVFGGTKATDLTAPAVREECMLYAFNVLTGVPVVKYNKTFESYYTGSSALEPVTGPVVSSTNPTNEEPYYYTLAWSKFELGMDTTGTDALGRPTVTWNADGVLVADNVGSRAPIATFTGSVNSGMLYTALGKATIDNLNKYIDVMYDVVARGATAPVDQIDVYVDGVLVDDHRGPAGPGGPATWAEIGANNIDNSIGGKGAVVELYRTYADGLYYLTVVVYYEYVGDVARISTANNNMTIDSYLDGMANVPVDGKYFDITGYEKDDVVVYTMGSTDNHATSNVLVSVRPAEYTTGTFTGYDLYMSPVFDGTAYSLSAKNDGTVVDAMYTNWEVVTGVNYKLYTDSYGNILTVIENDEVGVTGNYNYVYITNVSVGVEDGNPLTPDADAVAVTGVYADGGKEVLFYNVKVKGDDSYITFNNTKYYLTGANQLTAAADGSGDNVANSLLGWKIYTTDEAGNVTLRDINPNYAALNGAETVTVKKAIAKIDGIDGFTANSKTVLNVVNSTGAVKTYVGISNFPRIDVVSSNYDHVLYTYALKSKVIESITVYVIDAPINAEGQIAYCVFKNDGDATNGVYNYFFWIDGVMTPVQLDDGSLQGGTPYFLNFDGEDWDYTGIKTYVDGVDNAYCDSTKGMVNAMFNMFGSPATTPCVYYGKTDSVTGATLGYEWAVIDELDDNFFTTAAVENDADAIADSVAGIAVPEYTYYYDTNTKIYDATTGAALTELNVGDIFVAYVDETAESPYAGPGYCSYIWIVG